LGNPHPDDISNTSYHSQIASVFKVPNKKDLYIAVADRWMPDHMCVEYEEYAVIFEQMFCPVPEKSYLVTAWNKKPPIIYNTSIADYVWLPFRFDGKMGFLDWLDEWRLEDYY